MLVSARNAQNWTLADDANGVTSVEITVIGQRPKDRPYLRIAALNDGSCIATVTNANALRALAHRILRALGDES